MPINPASGLQSARVGFEHGTQTVCKKQPDVIFSKQQQQKKHIQKPRIRSKVSPKATKRITSAASPGLAERARVQGTTVTSVSAVGFGSKVGTGAWSVVRVCLQLWASLDPGSAVGS